MSNRWPGKFVIGLTGNIASGKSVVRRMLEALEAFSIDADGLAHRAMSPGAPAFQPVVDQFGKWLVGADGKIDRAKLANIVFTDADALRRLEMITHPIIKQVVDLLIRRSSQKVIVIEAIKLFEAGMAADCDSVWVVDAPESVQIQRLIEQRKMTEADAKMRIAAQSPQSDKLARANVIIYNGDGYENTFDQVSKHLAELTAPLEEAKKPEEEVKAPEEPVKEAEVPAAPPVEEKKEEAPVASADLKVRRGGPKDAEAIAAFLNAVNGTTLERSDVIMCFGQKAYVIAEAGTAIKGLGGWQVENLITRIDEVLVGEGSPVEETVSALIDSMEKASNQLQSEISLLFLPENAPEAMQAAVRKKGYEKQQAADLRIPDWREAAEESAPPQSVLNVKLLREDRVLKPI